MQTSHPAGIPLIPIEFPRRWAICCANSSLFRPSQQSKQGQPYGLNGKVSTKLYLKSFCGNRNTITFNLSNVCECTLCIRMDQDSSIVWLKWLGGIDMSHMLRFNARTKMYRGCIWATHLVSCRLTWDTDAPYHLDAWIRRMRFDSNNGTNCIYSQSTRAPRNAYSRPSQRLY